MTRSPRTLVVLALASGAVAPDALAAQTSASTMPGPLLGVLVGRGSATFGGSDADYSQSSNGNTEQRRAGLLAGVFATLPLAGTAFSLRPELLFAQRGDRVTLPVNLPTTSFTPPGGATYANTVAVRRALDYIDAPVLAQLDLGSGALRPALYAGPSVSYRVGCQLRSSYAGSTNSVACNDPGDVTGEGQNLRRWDASAVVGAQFTVPIGRQQVGAGARYTHGFASVYRGADVKNRMLSVYATLELPTRR